MSTLSRRQDDGDGKVDYTLGLYQSIGDRSLRVCLAHSITERTLGYKEFHVYLNASEPSQKDFDEAVENMKMATRRYAKRQVSWIQNKLLPAVHAINSHTKDRPVAPTYLLDATGACCNRFLENISDLIFRDPQNWMTSGLTTYSSSRRA
jgi:hypothetical protein